jgi:hypothetical protein
MTTTQICNGPAEILFYEITHALDDFSLTAWTLDIPAVAQEGAAEYTELIHAAARRRIELEQERLAAQN